MYLTYITGVGGNIDILYSRPRLSHPSQPQNSPVNEIQWLIKDTENVDHRPIQELCIEVGSTTVDNVYALEVDKKPGSDLVGTWKRAGTVGIS